MRVILTQLRNWFEDGEKNFDQALRSSRRSRQAFTSSDILVLPELVGAELERKVYLDSVGRVAAELGTWVVGGSHHHRRGAKTLNGGVVVSPEGSVVAEYEKHHPYGVEGALGISRGMRSEMFEVQGRSILVLLCADFWFASAFEHATLPDVVLVPTFSVTQRPSPDHARSLWKSMAISRAYEFATYVGISDWSRSSSYHGHKSCGVAGLANPSPQLSKGLYERLANRSVAVFTLDFKNLSSLRENRRLRNFL